MLIFLLQVVSENYFCLNTILTKAKIISNVKSMIRFSSKESEGLRLYA